MGAYILSYWQILKVLSRHLSMFLAHLSNSVYGSFIPRRYNFLQLKKLVVQSLVSLSGVGIDAKILDLLVSCNFLLYLKINKPSFRAYPSGFFHKLRMLSILAYVGSARDTTSPWYDGNTDTTSAVNTWKDHHSNTCSGATRYSSSQQVHFNI